MGGASDFSHKWETESVWGSLSQIFAMYGLGCEYRDNDYGHDDDQEHCVCFAQQTETVTDEENV